MPIAKLRPGTTATIDAEVCLAGIRPTRRPGFRIFEVIVRDETGPARAAFPNQAFLKDVFKPGQQVVLYGAVEFRGSGGLQFTNPEYEIIRGDSDERRFDGAHGAHRSDLREGRIDDAAHPAHDGASVARGDARRDSGSRCRSRFGAGGVCSIAGRRCRPPISRRPARTWTR